MHHDNIADPICMTCIACYSCGNFAARKHLHSMSIICLSLLMQLWPEGLAGIEVKVDRFSHKLPLLMDYIFKQLVSLTVEPNKFDRIREPGRAWSGDTRMPTSSLASVLLTSDCMPSSKTCGLAVLLQLHAPCIFHTATTSACTSIMHPK